MNAPMVFGVFCLYVAVASLFLVLCGHQDALLEGLRRLWGRTLGHSLYFLANVALPLLICIICLGWGVRVYDATAAVASAKTTLQLDLDSCRNLRLLLQKQVNSTHVDIVYGA